MTIKNEIKVNDDVVFITGTMIRKGVVLKINKTTYKIKFNAFHWDLSGIENIKKEKVAHADDVLICFWDCKKDKNHMESHWNYMDHQQHAHKATEWLGIGYNVSESADGNCTYTYFLSKGVVKVSENLKYIMLFPCIY